MKSKRIVPSRTIVPIFHITEEGSKVFLGTAFFTGEPHVLITCAHVLHQEHEHYFIAVPPPGLNGPGSVFEATLIDINSDIDLAILDVPEYIPEYSLQLAQNNEISYSAFVECLEYSTTGFVNGEILMNPATRRGNVTRIIDLTKIYGEAGRSALEVSFPAFQGSSGAPVCAADTFKLWGILKSNIEYHLLPASVARSDDEEGIIVEEKNYMLPNGMAIHVHHLREYLNHYQK